MHPLFTRNHPVRKSPRPGKPELLERSRLEVFSATNGGKEKSSPRGAALLLCALCFLLAGSLSAQAVPRRGPPGRPSRAAGKKPAEKKVLFIRAGKIFTVRGEVSQGGSILVRGGKIAAVDGPGLTPPEGAEILNFPRGVVVPGLIDASGSVLVEESDLEGLSGIDPARKTADALDPFDRRWREAVAAGVTAVYVGPGPKSVLAGTGVVVKLSGGVYSKELLLKGAAQVEGSLWPDASSFTKRDRGGASSSTVFLFGRRIDLRSGSAGGSSTYDLLEGYSRLRSAFLRAREYLRRHNWYEQDLGAWERRVAKLKKEAEEARRQGKAPIPKPKPPRPAPPREDPFAEALLPVLEGKERLRLWAESVEEIRLGLKLAREFSIKILFCGALEAHLAAREIAEAGAGVVLLPVDSTVAVRRGLRISPQAARSLFKADVQFGLGTGAPFSFRTHLLRHYAASLVARGLDPAYALRSVTLTNAELLGVSDRLGSLEPGKDADLVVFDGPPFATRSRVLLTVVGGKVVYRKEKTEQGENKK